MELKLYGWAQAALVGIAAAVTLAGARQTDTPLPKPPTETIEKAKAVVSLLLDQSAGKPPAPVSAANPWQPLPGGAWSADRSTMSKQGQ